MQGGGQGHACLPLDLVRFWPGQCPVRSGLAKIPSLERAMERVFAFSSGECDVVSLVGGHAGRDWPLWVWSGGTGLTGAGRAPGDAFFRGVISEQEGGMLNTNRVTSGRRKEPPCASPQPSLRNEGAAVR